MRTRTTRRYQDTPVDVRIVLSALWIAMLFVFAYVDIFAFYRADVLGAALDGTVAGTPFEVGQTFLTLALVYITPACLMVVLSLVLPARTARATNLVAAAVYAVTIVASVVGERWVYYVLGSGFELVLLAAVVRVSWTWPPPRTAAPGGCEDQVATASSR